MVLVERVEQRTTVRNEANVGGPKFMVKHSSNVAVRSLL